MRASTVTTTEAPYRRIDEDRLVIGLAALAVALHVIEAAIPSPLPGIRPGMANLITLLAFFRYGWRIACWITVLRVIGGSLLIGTFLTPTFILSVAGAALSLAALALARPLVALGAGPVGIAALAAVAHVLGQVAIAWLLFVPHPGLWALAPVLMAAALPMGVATGLLVALTLRRLGETE
jgi:heptaprenyl diphosphate synthase